MDSVNAPNKDCGCLKKKDLKNPMEINECNNDKQQQLQNDTNKSQSMMQQQSQSQELKENKLALQQESSFEYQQAVDDFTVGDYLSAAQHLVTHYELICKLNDVEYLKKAIFVEKDNELALMIFLEVTRRVHSPDCSEEYRSKAVSCIEAILPLLNQQLKAIDKEQEMAYWYMMASDILSGEQSSQLDMDQNQNQIEKQVDSKQISFLKKALELFDKNENIDSLAQEEKDSIYQANFCLGDKYCQMGRFSDAIQYLQKALTYKQTYMAHVNLAISYQMKAQYQNSLQHFDNAAIYAEQQFGLDNHFFLAIQNQKLQILKGLKKTDDVDRILGNINLKYSKYKYKPFMEQMHEIFDNDVTEEVKKGKLQALRYLQVQLEELAKFTKQHLGPSSQQEANFMHILGMNKALQNEVQKGIDSIKTSVRIMFEAADKDYEEISGALYNLGDLSAALKQYEEALKFHKQAYELRETHFSKYSDLTKLSQEAINKVTDDLFDNVSNLAAEAKNITNNQNLP